MKTIFRSLLLVLVACLSPGCGGPASPSDPDSASGPRSGPQAANDAGAGDFAPQRPSEAYADPRDAVRDFLTSVQRGDDKTATSLLTSAAQKEAWENGLAISADGFPDAKFDVSEVEYLNGKTEAHVASVWSDKAATGETKTFQCVWLLRQEQESWFIYGMATKVVDSLAPVVLNFEDQSDMMKKQRWAEEQIVKQRQREQATVQGPVEQVAQPKQIETQRR